METRIYLGSRIATEHRETLEPELRDCGLKFFEMEVDGNRYGHKFSRFEPRPRASPVRLKTCNVFLDQLGVRVGSASVLAPANIGRLTPEARRQAEGEELGSNLLRASDVLERNLACCAYSRSSRGLARR